MSLSFLFLELERYFQDPQGEQGVDAPIINGGVARRGPGRPRKPETPRKVGVFLLFFN